MELLKIMKRVELFRGLTDEQLLQVADISQNERYSAKQPICRQGEPGDKMFIVADGQVEVMVRTSKGDTYSAVYLGEGQLVGEMGLIDQTTRSATVIAVVDETIVYSISNEDFTKLCQADTGIGYIMMRNIAQDLSFKLRHRDTDHSGTP